MVDSLSGKLGSKIIDKAIRTSEQKADLNSLGDSPFKQMLGEMDIGLEFANGLDIGDRNMALGEGQLGVISAEGVDVDPANLVVGIERPDGNQKIIDLLSEVNKGQMQMGSLVNDILYGPKKFSNQELLAIQAHVFHFAQMTELTVKVAEQGVSSVKTVLNTQIQ